MQEWGYGDSLRKLSLKKLCSLHSILLNNDLTIETKYWDLDKQGKYMWSLMLKIGWKKSQVAALIIKKFNKSQWNQLNGDEKRRLINILKGYQK